MMPADLCQIVENWVDLAAWQVRPTVSQASNAQTNSLTDLDVREPYQCLEDQNPESAYRHVTVHRKDQSLEIKIQYNSFDDQINKCQKM